ncbi:hypothetical protein [Arenimonas oryziterrae]|uniref:Uncharacterized protein n=1 Tax=Arenimonas oryziterrae DSM 21050 = YC6267 TaxID=1121015 RepID=A0A091B981_9GAMM|nr:hypothetical protein [Arenimonas oryziterrae]KFN40985.1 hypothetical protein N789_03645 [Arenimonas oryziterrae DSM 21050 = YC6267]
MSQAYRLLREGMPDPQGRGAGHFHAEARKVKSWVAALPRANAQAAQQELEQALDSLSGQRLDGGSRLAAMEEIRGAVVESIGLLQQQYAGSALPLPAPKAQAAYQAEAFHLALAHGYRKAAVELCAPAGNIPMLRGGAVGQALERAAFHYSRALSVAWRVYRAPHVGTWQGLHRVHSFAVEQKLENKAVEDKVAGTSIEIRALYVQTLLMAVTNPLAFSQSEQDSLWQIARSYAPRCALLKQAPEENAPVVPEDADRGPGPGAAGESHSQWLDMRPFSQEVDSAIARQQDGFSELVPARGVGIRVSAEMLVRLKRAFGLAAARSHKRLTAGHELRTVIGLSSLHFHLAGLRDFDTFMRQSAQHVVHTVTRAEWASGGSTDLARVPVYSATVRDQSLGGYRMSWDNAEQIRARVGELVGITLAEGDEDPEWMLGVVRWLRYEANGGLSAGVELMSRNAVAVGLRIHERDGSIRPAMRGLEIDSLDGGDERCFVAASLPNGEPLQLDVVRDGDPYAYEAKSLKQDLLAGVDVLMNAGDYSVLRPLRQDLVMASEAASEPAPGNGALA